MNKEKRLGSFVKQSFLMAPFELYRSAKNNYKVRGRKYDWEATRQQFNKAHGSTHPYQHTTYENSNKDYIKSGMDSKEYFDEMLNSDSESSEDSIDSDTASHVGSITDKITQSSSDENEMARTSTCSKLNTNQQKQNWYHMPDVSAPDNTHIGTDEARPSNGPSK